MMTVATKVNVEMYAIAAALASGMEGGINYWAEITGFRRPRQLKVTLDRLSAERYPGTKRDRETVYRHVDYALNSGGGVRLRETEGAEPREMMLTWASLRKGVALMAERYPKQFGRLVALEGDSGTGDVLIQLSVFGEVIYG